jgi:2-keto-4-pentenoate hydratase
MDDSERTKAADALMTASADRVAIAPLTETLGGFDIDEAYEIQLVQIARRVRAGAKIKGHKVGLTSAAMQAQFGVDQPDFGHLLDDMFFAEHEAVPFARFLQPRVEPEIALVLRSDLAGPGVNMADAASAVSFVVPALELIDSRIRDWRITISDTIADNASSAGVVLGSRIRRLEDCDLRLTGVTLHRNGELVGTGAGGAVMGNPLAALVWLANVLGARGSGLRAGQVVLPGSMTASVPASAGDTLCATYAGLGSVSVHFSAAAAAEGGA